MSEECERECLFMSEWSGWSGERACCLSFLLRSLTGKRTNEAVKEELSTNVRSRRDQPPPLEQTHAENGMHEPEAFLFSAAASQTKARNYQSATFSISQSKMGKERR